MHSLNCRWGFEPADRHAIRLLEILGSRAFTRLQEEFGGKRVWVPKAGARFPCAACNVRSSCVKRWRKAGRTPQAIAEHLGVSAKTVYRLLDLAGQKGSEKDSEGKSCRAKMAGS
ncbi:MAG: helix-turn-helix domain-containing protein [Elusimicrobia bacterium]|nr:helix-turn-helix domain-containing protein [Elusimicrobiota bacterium]